MGRRTSPEMRTLPEVIVSPSVCAITPLPPSETRSSFFPFVLESITQNLLPVWRRIQLSTPGTSVREVFTSSVGLASSRFVMTTYEAKLSSVEMAVSTG